MTNNGKKKKVEKGWFVNLNAGNVDKNVAFFNKAMGTTSEAQGTTNGGEGMSESVKEHKQIRIKDWLRQYDTQTSGTDDYLDLLGQYEMVELDLTTDKKKEIANLIYQNKVEEIDRLLRKEIDKLEWPTENDPKPIIIEQVNNKGSKRWQ